MYSSFKQQLKGTKIGFQQYTQSFKEMASKYARVRYYDDVIRIIPLSDIRKFTERKWVTDKNRKFKMNWPPSDAPEEEHSSYEVIECLGQVLDIAGGFSQLNADFLETSKSLTNATSISCRNQGSSHEH